MVKAIGIGKALGVVFIVAVFALAGCSKAKSPTASEVTKAVAVMMPTDGSKVKGTVTFTQQKNGVLVTADFEGLTPGLHGFHIHEYGDCTSPDANSAGGHFNPTGMPHGARTDAKRHVGDLGNIEAVKGAPTRVEFVDTQISLQGPNSILGRGIIIHSQADDFKSQPTGAAGARVACGVIGVMK